jgi:hypothetical protein
MSLGGSVVGAHPTVRHVPGGDQQVMAVPTEKAALEASEETGS